MPKFDQASGDPVDVIREIKRAAERERLHRHYEQNRERVIQRIREWQQRNPFGVSRGREYVRRSFGNQGS